MRIQTPSIPPCPAAGTGCHAWLMGAANTLCHTGVSPADAVQILTSGMTRRPNPAQEVVDAVTKAYQEHGNGSAIRSMGRVALLTHPKTPKWPKVNSEQIEAITKAGTGLDGLIKSSPRSCHQGELRESNWVISRMFPPHSLICVGRSSEAFLTLDKEGIMQELHEYQFIVPSPMSALMGARKSDGRPSAHTLANTGPRRYMVCEFDQGERDAQASIIMHLATVAPLALVVFSGGKSLHSWFWVEGQEEEVTLKFFRYAVSLGADPPTWVRSQFVRMPDGTRKDGTRQHLLYYNPEVIHD